MIMNMYSIFDVASGAYMRPFFMMADSAAVRSFTDIATDAEHEVGKHPKDYSLIRCGTFDDSNAELHNEHTAVLISALEAIATSRNVPAAQRALFEEKVQAEQSILDNMDKGLGQ